MVVKIFGHDGQAYFFEMGELSEIERAGMCVCDERGICGRPHDLKSRPE